MTFAPKRWTSLGLGIALLGAAGLSACGGEDGERNVAPAGVETGESGEAGEHGEAGESGESGEHGEAGEGGESGEAGALSLPKRLAFMTGHVEAGLALYRAGEAEMAAKHLLHPVSETHATEREGLSALGFDASLFEAVSDALEAGKPAADVEPQLATAEENLRRVTVAAGGDTIEVLEFLLETIVEEYKIGVPADSVVDAGEFQDAYGFAVVASGRAEALEGDVGERVRGELGKLLALWADGPVPVDTPASASLVTAQVGNVRLELSLAK